MESCSPKVTWNYTPALGHKPSYGLFRAYYTTVGAVPQLQSLHGRHRALILLSGDSLAGHSWRTQSVLSDDFGRWAFMSHRSDSLAALTHFPTEVAAHCAATFFVDHALLFPVRNDRAGLRDSDARVDDPGLSDI